MVKSYTGQFTFHWLNCSNAALEWLQHISGVKATGWTLGREKAVDQRQKPP